MDLTRDERALLASLPDGGEARGNLAVRRQVGWDADRYWAARDSLVDKGLVIRGRGQGGSVRRVVESRKQGGTLAVDVDPSDPVRDLQKAVQGELDLYKPMRHVIEGDWAKDHRSDHTSSLMCLLRTCRA